MDWSSGRNSEHHCPPPASVAAPTVARFEEWKQIQKPGEPFRSLLTAAAFGTARWNLAPVRSLAAVGQERC
jgi:hypothetical protein